METCLWNPYLLQDDYKRIGGDQFTASPATVFTSFLFILVFDKDWIYHGYGWSIQMEPLSPVYIMTPDLHGRPGD